MKILTINGSPHLHGCTDRALLEVEKTLEENGIEYERFNIGNKDIRGCIACNYCRTHGKCVFNDQVNEFAPKFAEADGIIIGTPIYWAGANGQALTFLVKAIKAQKEAEGAMPHQEHDHFTNFIH